MAPSSTARAHLEERLVSKGKNKLRKPAVEKVRRDRINSSIEALKHLLENEFQSQQPNSKLEKADILEVAVRCLQQRCQAEAQGSCPKNPHPGFDQGYLNCLRQSVHYLTYCDPSKGTQAQQMNAFGKIQLAGDHRPPASWVTPSSWAMPSSHSQFASKQTHPDTHRLWRPW